jgi:hypothetical protein
MRQRLSYFSVMKQYFLLTPFQHKHQYKLNFSISQQGMFGGKRRSAEFYYFEKVGFVPFLT